MCVRARACVSYVSEAHEDKADEGREAVEKKEHSIFAKLPNTATATATCARTHKHVRATRVMHINKSGWNPSRSGACGAEEVYHALALLPSLFFYIML